MYTVALSHFLCGVITKRAPRRVNFNFTFYSNLRPYQPSNLQSSMPSIKLHTRPSEPAATTTATATAPSHAVHNPLPQLLQTPSGLALLELQGTINVPSSENEHDTGYENSPNSNTIAASYETPIGKLMFPDYSPQNPNDTEWMKRAYLYVGRYQRMTGEVKKLPRPIAVLQKRAGCLEEELEVVEIVRYKVFFKNRPEPVNDV